MRANIPGGRFTIPYEIDSMRSGITSDLRRPVGQWMDWWVYDPDETDIDPIYDVGDYAGGRRWKDPFPMPAISAVILQGQTVQNERGFYQTDVARFVLNVVDVLKILPGIVYSPDQHIRDRFVYRNEVFTPTRFYMRGLVTDQYTVITMDANQVNPEELINDPQFQSYADAGTSPPPPPEPEPDPEPVLP